MKKQFRLAAETQIDNRPAIKAQTPGVPLSRSDRALPHLPAGKIPKLRRTTRSK